jgi:hypothetical protein
VSSGSASQDVNGRRRGRPCSLIAIGREAPCGSGGRRLGLGKAEEDCRCGRAFVGGEFNARDIVLSGLGSFVLYRSCYHTIIDNRSIRQRMRPYLRFFLQRILTALPSMYWCMGVLLVVCGGFLKFSPYKKIANMCNRVRYSMKRFLSSLYIVHLAAMARVLLLKNIHGVLPQEYTWTTK